MELSDGQLAKGPGWDRKGIRIARAQLANNSKRRVIYGGGKKEEESTDIYSPNRCSAELIDSMNPKTTGVRDMSESASFASGVEIIDAPELAKRLQVPVSWVRQRATSPRFNQEQRIPHVRLGRYVRFLWGSKELKAWLQGCSEQ
jgi:hypothetical protein